MDVLARVEQVRERIARAVARRGPGPDVCIVAVVKRQPLERIEAVVGAGIFDIGENYAQDLRRHRSALAHRRDLRFHFIGALQRNKVRHVLGAHRIHTVDRPALVEALEARAAREGMFQDVLVEVNVGRESTKAGVLPEALPDLLACFAEAPHLRCRGLMCLPPPSPPDEARGYFRELRHLRDRFVRGPTERAMDNVELVELSMGTSADFEAAILEGATHVRLGTVLLGPREAPPHEGQGA
ncbi:MAG: YggS family pyridoxal phosphate-dependent enzyme [Deltaproteobacteria bacterium]|nr:MAG: YggS family pyridoxal phosphate-dependent enzyme [Deltaproteobacteria bacterium]